MDLTKLLNALRQATTPEARAAAMAALSRAERATAMQVAMTRVRELRANDNRSADENTEYGLLIDGAQSLRTLIDAENEAENRFAELDAFDRNPVNTRGLMGTGVQRTHQPGEHAPTYERGRQVGVDLVQIGDRALDHEGMGMPERAFRRSLEPTYVRAWWQMLRGKADRADFAILNEVGTECRAYDTGLIDPDGGYATPPQFLADIVGPDAYPSGLLDEVTNIPCNGQSFSFLKNNYSGSDIYNSPFRKDRTSGLSGPTEQANQPMGLIEVPIHEAYIKVKVPRGLLEDYGAIQQHIRDQMRDTYRLGTEYELSLGTGVGEPEGLHTNVGGTGMSSFNVGTSPDLDKWVKLYREVPPMYRANAKLVMSDTAYQDVESTEDANGAFPFAVLNLTTSGATNGPTERYRGKPIIFAPFYPDYGSANKVATWGDHRRAYYYGLRLAATMGVRNLADESYVVFTMRIRDGGKLVLPQAVRCAIAS
jgi:HK97 family phage major capsid protein